MLRFLGLWLFTCVLKPTYSLKLMQRKQQHGRDVQNQTSHFSHSFYYTQLFSFTSVGETKCLMQTPDTNASKHVLPWINRTHLEKQYIPHSDKLLGCDLQWKTRGKIPTYISVLWLSQSVLLLWVSLSLLLRVLNWNRLSIHCSC